MISNKEKENILGLILINFTEHLKIIKKKEKENLKEIMEMYSLEIGLMML